MHAEAIPNQSESSQKTPVVSRMCEERAPISQAIFSQVLIDTVKLDTTLNNKIVFAYFFSLFSVWQVKYALPYIIQTFGFFGK